MITDSFFQQGVTHEVCEDYALANDSFVALSDGCSNGGGPRIDSDWGARLFCKSAEQYQAFLRDQGFSTYFCQICMGVKAQIKHFPTLSKDCLTATLLTLVGTKNYFKGLVCGDGAIGARKKDGTWVIDVFEFLPGGITKTAAPFYPKYMMYDEIETYSSLFGVDVLRTRYSGDLNGDLEISKETLDVGIDGFWTYNYPYDEYDLTFVASDGISSFFKTVKTETSKYTEPVEALDVLRVLLDIRSFRPGFLRLQRNWAFKMNTPGTFQYRDWKNGDDVSMGVIFNG